MFLDTNISPAFHVDQLFLKVLILIRYAKQLSIYPSSHFIENIS